MVDIYVGSHNTHWILHEKLLCYRSPFFRNIFHKKTTSSKPNAYGLPDEDDEAFKLFVGWLYSEHLPPPSEEKDLSPLLDLYLMAEKFDIPSLQSATLSAMRRHYHDANTWPSLRRVQHIYANTSPGSPMRELLVSCVARMLVLGGNSAEGLLPRHWENAMRKDGQMAVDVILCVQKWGLEAERVPDPREEDGEVEEKVVRLGDGGDDDVEEDDEENILDWGEAKTVSADGSRSQSMAAPSNGN